MRRRRNEMKMKQGISFLVMVALIITLLPVGIFAAEGTIVVKLGSPWMTVNGKRQEIDQGRNTTPKTIQGRTMVPLRFVSENLGADVAWNSGTQEATISLNGGGVAQNNYTPEKGFHRSGDMIINNIEVTKSDYRIKDPSSFLGYYISTEKLESALRFPPEYGLVNTYPKIRINNGIINISWEDEGTVPLEVVMEIGSTMTDINGDMVDMEAAPFEEGGKVFLPFSIFIGMFDLEFLEAEEGIFGYFQSKNVFPTSNLIGHWSNSHTDMFTSFKDIPSGAVGLSSSEQGYIFNDDETYTSWIMSVGGFKDGFAQHKGNYVVTGNTIILYNRVETYYEGRPLILKYKDKPLQKRSYQYIEDYRPNEGSGKIKIGGTWLNLVK